MKQDNCYCSKSYKVLGTGRCYRQNRLFENNQRQFYRELDQEEERCDDDQPVAEESKQFWGKKDAKWLSNLRTKVNVKKQEKIDITTGSLTGYFVGCQIGSHQVQT